jgi:hypothetical protein
MKALLLMEMVMLMTRKQKIRLRGFVELGSYGALINLTTKTTDEELCGDT